MRPVPRSFCQYSMSAAAVTQTNVLPIPPASPAALPVLTVVIPALNEEEAIGSTIRRCLEARQRICRAGRVSDVEIVVVSDGSTDRTPKSRRNLLRAIPSVSVIVFEKNRGYGAAIKEGFKRGRGEPDRVPRRRWHLRSVLFR